MHHKYDISLKDAFYIIDLAAGIFSSGRWKTEPDEKEKWGDKMCLFAYDSNFSQKKIPAARSMILNATLELTS